MNIIRCRIHVSGLLLPRPRGVCIKAAHPVSTARTGSRCAPARRRLIPIHAVARPMDLYPPRQRERKGYGGGCVQNKTKTWHSLFAMALYCSSWDKAGVDRRHVIAVWPASTAGRYSYIWGGGWLYARQGECTQGYSLDGRCGQVPRSAKLRIGSPRATHPRIRRPSRRAANPAGR